MVQVLTTDEGEKQGIEPKNVMNLVDYVISNCKNLNFIGLMSIGKIGDVDGFHLMSKLKIDIQGKYGLEKVDLSIGTSADYELAILEGGSTEIRVGSQIFGARDYSAH